MKRLLLLFVILFGISAFPQNTLTASFGYAPTANVPACSATVTSNCVSGFRFQSLTSQTSTPAPQSDPVIGTIPASVALNSDGTFKTCTAPNLSCITGTTVSGVAFKLGPNYLYGVTVYKDATGAVLTSQNTSAVAVGFLEPQAPNNLKAVIP